jgi:epsilon-lactone hydrolase
VKIDLDGTLHTDELTISPSEHWSAEFKSFYAKMVAGTTPRTEFKPPLQNAPAAEWEQFDSANDSLMAESLDTARRLYPVNVEDTKLGGVRVGIITPEGGVATANRRRVLINLRGGGFVYNRGLSFGQLESIPVASLGGIKVITVDYRQAPLYAYPAASEDVEAVYKELLKKYSPTSIGIYGCSAGGALTAQAVAWFEAKDLPRPGAVGIFSFAPSTAPWPWGKEGDSRIWRSSFVPKSQLSDADDAAMQPILWYMQNADASDPKAYPGSSDAVLARFPPTLFLVGSREYWLSSAVVAHAKLLHMNVDASLYVMEGAPHAAHVSAVGTPEAHDANAYIARWFDEHLAQ